MPYDQLTAAIGPLATLSPEQAGIVFVESPWKAGRRPYHQQKLALVIANGRHFLLEQAARGVAIDYRVATTPYAEALAPVIAARGPLVMMRPAERELRVDLQPLVDRGQVKLVDHQGWLSTADDLAAAHANGPPYRMDRFYAQLRRRTGYLMDHGKPRGGRFSHDGENRQRWPGSPRPPRPPVFAPDAITEEVIALVESRFSHHPGRVDRSFLPTTQADAERLWQWVKAECLPLFGPFEDAMAEREHRLWHTRLSGLINLHRLLPLRIVEESLALSLPLPSQEGFLRQILGWREFVHQVHDATDGFRNVETTRLPAPGDGGWNNPTWRGTSGPPALCGGIDPNPDANPLPPAYWGKPSGLHCLDHVVQSVWQRGWSHHITRLMILSNLAMLLELSPRQLTDWFWVAYEDAYDWVVEPNVLNMGTYAVADLMTTKPYIAGSAYIDKMSDLCKHCALDPKTTCPLTRMYWAYLARHASELSANQRMAVPLAALKKRKPEDRARDRETFERVTQTLLRGESLAPLELPLE